MIYEFECTEKDGKHIPVACALTTKSDYRNILESRLEYHVGADSVDWFASRVDLYKRSFRER